jgi:hypothetical protein
MIFGYKASSGIFEPIKDVKTDYGEIIQLKNFIISAL